MHALGDSETHMGCIYISAREAALRRRASRESKSSTVCRAHHRQFWRAQIQDQLFHGTQIGLDPLF